MNLRPATFLLETEMPNRSRRCRNLGCGHSADSRVGAARRKPL